MNAVLKLTGYDKASEFLTTIVTVPVDLVPFAREVAGAPDDDPGVAGLYPLSVPLAEAIAAEAGLALDPDRFEAIAEDEWSRPSTV